MSEFLKVYRLKLLGSVIACFALTIIMILYVQNFKNELNASFLEIDRVKQSIIQLQALNKSLILKAEKFSHTQGDSDLQAYKKALAKHGDLIDQLKNTKIRNGSLNFKGWEALKGDALRRHEQVAIVPIPKGNSNPKNLILSLDEDYNDLQTQYDSLIEELQASIDNLQMQTLAQIEVESLIIYFLIFLDLSVLFFFIYHQYFLFKKALEDATQAQKEKNLYLEHLALVGDVSSSLNHEVKNMMTIIAGYLNQLPRHLLKAGIKEEDSISNVVQKLQKTVDYTQKVIAAVSNITHQGVIEELQLIHVNTVIVQAFEYGQIFANKNNVHIELQEQNESLYIIGREVSFIQVLINLIKNAVEAVRGTQAPWVRIKWNIIDENLQILIQDSGFGIPQLIQKKLFTEKFTTKPKGVGTGLGLNISRKIADEHKGTLYIDNSFKNTTFVFEIPLARRLQNPCTDQIQRIRTPKENKSSQSLKSKMAASVSSASSASSVSSASSASSVSSASSASSLALATHSAPLVATEPNPKDPKSA